MKVGRVNPWGYGVIENKTAGGKLGELLNAANQDTIDDPLEVLCGPTENEKCEKIENFEKLLQLIEQEAIMNSQVKCSIEVNDAKKITEFKLKNLTEIDLSKLEKTFSEITKIVKNKHQFFEEHGNDAYIASDTVTIHWLRKFLDMLDKEIVKKNMGQLSEGYGEHKTIFNTISELKKDVELLNKEYLDYVDCNLNQEIEDS